MKPLVASILVGLALAAGAGCASHTDDVCQDIGDCAQGGSSNWIESCEAEANLVRDEAASSACGAAFDAYFSCADSSYTCHGATALFPGCADHLTTLDSCLVAATASTACARLEAAEASCAASRPDAGTVLGTPPACSAARDCQARCYLASVRDVCAPQVDELETVAACAASCPL